MLTATLSQARALFEKAVTTAPDSAEAHLHFALFLEAQKEMDIALQHSLRSVELDAESGMHRCSGGLFSCVILL